MNIVPILKGNGCRVVRSVRMCGQAMHLMEPKYLRQGYINFTKNLRQTSNF